MRGLHGDVQKTHAFEIHLENRHVRTETRRHSRRVHTTRPAAQNDDSSREHPRDTTQKHAFSSVVLCKEVSSNEDRHPAGDFAHRFKEGQAAVHLDRFISDAGCARRNEALCEQPVRGQVKIRKENLALAKQPAFRFKRFLDLHDHVCPLKSLSVLLNDFRARRPVVRIVKPDPRPRVGFHKNVMAALNELVDGRRQQCHTKFLFLNLFRDADCHAANIFSSPVHDKFFALSGKSVKESRRMISRHLLVVLAALGGVTASFAQQDVDKGLEEASEDYMRDELGVNEITAPSIAQILKDFGNFIPVPMEVIATNPRDAVYDNRLQTSLHFGALVADGFMLTIAERSQDVQDIGRALIRQSRALGVGDRLTKRSKSLFEYSEKGDWNGMREELVRTQEDVEKSMLDLHDEQMSHMISLGGWLRGFQLAANSCAQSYSPDKALILGRVEIMDYYIDRLDTLHPRLKKTEFVSTLISKIKSLRDLAAQAEGRAPTEAEVRKMRDLADSIEAVALAQVDSDGKIIPTP